MNNMNNDSKDMKNKQNAGVGSAETFDDGAGDALLEQALSDFKSSMHAWSDAAYHRPRSVAAEVKHRSWRLALGWAMGCLLVVGSASGALFEREHRHALARMAAEQQAAEQQKLQQEQQAAKENEEDLLAQVDADVSRQVPSALAPLTEVMSDDESK